MEIGWDCSFDKQSHTWTWIVCITWVVFIRLYLDCLTTLIVVIRLYFDGLQNCKCDSPLVFGLFSLLATGLCSHVYTWIIFTRLVLGLFSLHGLCSQLWSCSNTCTWIIFITRIVHTFTLGLCLHVKHLDCFHTFWSRYCHLLIRFCIYSALMLAVRT